MVRRAARLLALAVAAAAASTAGCGSMDVVAPTAASTVTGSGGQQLDAYLTDLASSNRFTGSVLVARHGAVLLSKGYGLADEDRKIPNASNTRFRIGSNTKQFTAMAILILQEQGRLSVTDPVCRFVPQCPAAWAPITLEHLLLHTSGIPDYINSPGFPALIGQPATVAELVARFSPLPLEFTPGDHWKYSNSGYTLLGDVIEIVSGQTYADYLRDHVFAPLGMADSGFDSNTPSLPQHATGYLRAGVKPVFLDMSEFYAAGALYSTVEDLYRWDRALVAGQVVPAGVVQQAFTPHVACPAGGCALGTDLGYGYGWFVADQAGHRYVYHWGRIDGFLSSNGLYTDDDLDVIVLNNLESVDVFGTSTTLGTRALALP